MVPVGEKTAVALREKLIPAIEGIRVDVSSDPNAEYGTVVTAAHKDKIEQYIRMCADEGGGLVVDWSAPILSRIRFGCREYPYGNSVAIFTRNCHAAREFAARVNVVMVGINIPILLPVAYHNCGGWKR